jgi:hypothetical protein
VSAGQPSAQYGLGPYSAPIHFPPAASHRLMDGFEFGNDPQVTSETSSATARNIQTAR